MKSLDVINLIAILRNEIKKNIGNLGSSLAQEMNIFELFSLFVVRRKIKLLRFLFTQDDLKFSPKLLIRSFELEAYDISALLYKEFFRLLRDVEKKDLEENINSIVASFNRSNGMIDYKCYLAR